MRKLYFLFILLLIALAPQVFAKQGHMKLLAVVDTEHGQEGGTADLYLEIKPGTGRVFLETFPLTRTDTQMSTRFAKAIACDAVEKDCDDLDFFYTINANSAIVAGPSAGASIAVLTVAMLEDLNLNEDYVITGTINSGGLIGPVGGLKAKMEAAGREGFKKAFIPAGEILIKENNQTVDLKNLSKQLGIEIIEISTLNDAVEQFTGKKIGKDYSSIKTNEVYLSTMKSLAKELCDRSSRLKSETDSLKITSNTSYMRENAKNLTTKGKEAFERQTFYSSASYCFGASVEYSTLNYLSKKLDKQKTIREISKLKDDIKNFRSSMEGKDKNTITDLEAYIIIKERLSEAEQLLTQALLELNQSNSTAITARSLAFAQERINSAHSWSSFLGKEGKKFHIDEDILRKSCQNKISEADERKQYVELYIPNQLDNIQKEIESASYELANGNYEECLSIASRAKADVDIILSVFGVDSGQYENLVNTKLEIVKNSLGRQISKGVFPILGYSYYEYANTLKDTDLFSALLYSEYALELGNLDIYFKESNGHAKPPLIAIDKKMINVFLIGLMTGVMITYIMIIALGPSHKISERKSKKKRKN